MRCQFVHPLLILLILSFAACQAFSADPIKALLVTGGCCHDYDNQKTIIADGLAARANIEVTVVHQGGTATDSKIPLYEDPNWAKGYDVVIHDECFAEIKDAAWTQRVLKPHQNGTPAVLIHCAMHCYRDGTDQWFKFCGVTSHGHGSHYGHEVLNRDAEHPIMKTFGPAWMNPKGELYEITKLWPSAHALASSKNREKGHEDVCVWTNDYDGTPVFGTTLGHHNETVSSPEFLDLLTRGTLWSCGKLNDEFLKLVKPVEYDDSKVLADVKIPDGFEATVFAAPPAVKYPVFVAAAEDGTLYVAVDQNGSLDRELKRGSIYRLRDIDKDGRADEVKLFVSDVDSPRGMVWDHDRLYVMHPPHLSAFIDTDNDGHSDKQQYLVKDIAFGFKDRPADHTSNGVSIGIDGWLYLAIGDFGFMKATGDDGRTVQLRGGGVVRVRPDGSGMEVYSNGTRNILEVAVDPLLNGFTRDNTNDGGGWDIRLHHFTGFEDHGYPRLYMNFGDEIIQPLADYGGGSGCGALYLDEPGFPDGMGNALYTADWGIQKVLRHTLSPNGATFSPTQDDFVTLPRVTDLDVDANSTLYLSSWKGATFKYVGDEVGYILQMKPKGYRAAKLPDFDKLNAADLVAQLRSPSHRRRMAASRCIVRNGIVDAGKGLREVAIDNDAELSSRVAAIFTLKQLEGTASHRSLAEFFDHVELQPFVVRALADRSNQAEGIPTTLFAQGLNAANPRTRLESAVAIARLELNDLATHLAGRLNDSDPVVAHTVRQCLIRMEASAPCFEILGSASQPDDRIAALRVLQLIHKDTVVDELLERAGQLNGERHREIWTALCRLHFIDGEWKGNSWGTRPDTRGPYYQPETWSASAKISEYLSKTLETSAHDDAPFFVKELSRHRIRLDGMTSRLIDLAKQSDESLPLLLNHLKEEEDLDPDARAFMLAIAERKDFPAAHRKAAVPLLMQLGELRATEAILNWIQDDKGIASSFVRDRNLSKAVPHLVSLSNGNDEKATRALMGLAVASTKKRISDDMRTLANDALDEKWESNRLQYLTGVRQSRNKEFAPKIRVALKDADSSVASLAKEIAADWKLEDEPTLAGPPIKSLEKDAVLAAAIEHRGSAEHGKALFERLECSKCHTVKQGETLRGPYLPNVVKTYKRNQLAESILLPNKSIAQGFVTNVFVLDDGRQIVGFVTNEGDTELTVRDREGKELKISVESIEDRTTQTVSVMPEGLIDSITTDDFGSLLTYLESLATE